MHRRRLLALGATALGFSGCFGTGTDERTPTDPRNQTPKATTPESQSTTSIGGSLHGRPFRIDDKIGLVEKSETEWMHAFLDVRGKYERNADPPNDPDVVALKRLKRETDANLFVTLMWNFTGMFDRLSEKELPAAGSADERALIEYAIELLHAIDEPVDIIALGNEPIHEALYADVVGNDSNLIAFTRTLKDAIVDDYTTGEPLLLAGAFNRLYDTAIRREYRSFNHQLFTFARNDNDIDGIDLHIHYTSFEQAETMVSIARQQFPGGIITATEFSPVWRYYRNINKPITSFDGGDEFADRHGIDPDTTSADYFEAAKHDPISPVEMEEYMEIMPWYNVNFVEDMYALLNEYDIAIGTFGFLVEDDVRELDWTDRWYPFPINCLYQPVLIDSEDGAHPHYLDDFRNRANPSSLLDLA